MIDAALPGPTGTTRADVLAVHSVDHFALGVPDLAAAERFYGTFGLTVDDAPSGLRLSTPQGLAGRIGEAAQRRLEYLSFGIDADALAPFGRRLEAGGVARADPPRGAPGDGVWFRDCDGVLVEVTARARRSPRVKSPTEIRIAPAGVRRAAEESGTAAAPRRLGHVLRFTPDVARIARFYERFLGLRVADRSGDIIAFMYSPHGSDHHVVAFARSSRPGFHHASFDVGAIDAIGLGALRMAEHGYREGWGFGRHEAGSNFFHYVRDPWGGFAEYFCDIDFIPAGLDWAARDVPPEQSLMLWGPPVPAYFLENHEAAS